MMNKLYNIRDELKTISSREATFEKCVKDRLNKSVIQHTQYVDRICKYLSSRNSLKVLKHIKDYNNKTRKLKNDKVK